MKAKTVKIGEHTIPVVPLDELPKALGLKPGDTIEIRTPQFDAHPDDPRPGSPPRDFAALRAMPIASLREMGLRAWNAPTDVDATDGEFDGAVLMLFPHSWYEHIPRGFEIVDIMGGKEAFVPGTTDNDKRFGCLAYGILVTP